MEAESKVEPKVEPITAKQAAEPRGQSTIEFPYLDLGNATEIGVAVHEVGGSGCEWDQLAAHMKQSAQGGGFRMRMISARQFGVVTYDRGKISLTSLGLRIVDPQQSRAAKVESFLQVHYTRRSTTSSVALPCRRTLVWSARWLPWGSRQSRPTRRAKPSSARRSTRASSSSVRIDLCRQPMAAQRRLFLSCRRHHRLCVKLAEAVVAKIYTHSCAAFCRSFRCQIPSGPLRVARSG